MAILLTVLFASREEYEGFTRIDEYVPARLRAHLIPGASLVIVRDNSVIYAKGFGRARGDQPMTIDTPLVIGSLSKAFTATAVMQLVDERKIDLDSRVQQLIPEFQLADRAAAAKITVRHLLNQSSGIPGNAPRAQNSPAPVTLLEHVIALRDTELVSSPGGPHVYSSPNYQLLGLIVERVSGMSFADYMQRRIFTPLQMTRTFTDLPSAQRAGLAPGHSLWFGIALPSTYRHEPDRLPTASIITTARDLGRFASAHLGDGSPILSAESMKIAHTGVAPAGSYFKYAMGWRAGETAGVQSLWHGGALPSYRGAVVLIPEHKIGVVLLTNGSSMFADHTREIASGIIATFYDKEPIATARPLKHTYIAIAIAAVLLLILQIRSLVKAARGRGRKTSRRRIVAFDLVLPLAVVALLPLWLKLSWRVIYESAPDIAAMTALLITLAIITGILKLRMPAH
ncbi:MAG TPA: serine hydrolase domain-containing protein [Thermoanaerobaculia bacterium]|nr:serine hydrolase domain-containing protein [Thermoanaerobaculia bacterium]